MIPEIVQIRWHPLMDDAIRVKLEFVETILESENDGYRSLVADFEKICEINRKYRIDLEMYVDNEKNKWIRMINLYVIDKEYDYRYNRAVKRFIRTMKKI